MAGMEGGSGILSIADRRNARAQSRKVATFDGESDDGIGRAITSV
jgi:hypothetical protein